MIEDNSWTDEALCAKASNEQLEQFYSDSPKERAQAQALCFSCPVKDLCLKTALDNEERFGVWGSVDQLELRRVQSIDERGKPHVYSKNRPVRCPKCGPRSTKFLKVLDRKRTRTHIECTNCGLDWTIKKAINKKSSNF